MGTTKTKPCPTYRNNPECEGVMKTMSHLCVSCRNLSDREYYKEEKRFKRKNPGKPYKERLRGGYVKA